MANIAADEIYDFLTRLSERISKPAAFYLLGGGALCILGNPRRTVDIDYTFETQAAEAQNFQSVVQSVADEMVLELEAVSIDEFIPLPAQVIERRIHVGEFGQLSVYVYDPYSIALSKLARGFEVDLQDVQFLLRQKFIVMGVLEHLVEEALPHAWNFDIDPADMRRHFEVLRRLEG
jgi:hypothetical protein